MSLQQENLKKNISHNTKQFTSNGQSNLKNSSNKNKKTIKSNSSKVIETRRPSTQSVRVKNSFSVK